MKAYKIKFVTVVILFVALIFSGCMKPEKEFKAEDYEIAVLWADMALFITKNTPANSPTFASRGFGYLGLTMYESVVQGFPQKQSLSGQLNQLSQLPLPDQGKKYNWLLALNAGQALMLRSLYGQTSELNKQKIDSLETLIFTYYSRLEKDPELVERSVLFGRKVAKAIFKWSIKDGGHRGYLTNFDVHMRYPVGPGTWRAPFFSQTISRFPLHPHWGENRPFLKADQNWAMPAFTPYDTSDCSIYFDQFQKVYEANKGLTEEQKEIALWWNDDPSDTFTPPGHSYNLAGIVIKDKKPDLVTAAETYARVGMAVADAFIVCWKMKYTFFSERPSTFITQHIDDEWQPFWPDPPFPAFPSGHATQASAVAVVLAGLYGDKTSFVDNTHAKRPRDKMYNISYKERKFHSFWEAAEETAYSRFLGGIHTEQDNQVGLSEGSKVGQNINNLAWNQPATASIIKR